jgi:hypothetical protein
MESLENNAKILPFTLFSNELQNIPNTLLGTRERLPLVIETYKSEAFCRSIPLWVGSKKTVKTNGFHDLIRKLEMNGMEIIPSLHVGLKPEKEQNKK